MIILQQTAVIEKILSVVPTAERILGSKTLAYLVAGGGWLWLTLFFRTTVFFYQLGRRQSELIC